MYQFRPITDRIERMRAKVRDRLIVADTVKPRLVLEAKAKYANFPPVIQKAMEEYYDEPLEDGSYQAYPMLWVPDIYGRTGVYYHPGNAYGSYNIVSYDPETGDGVVVLTTGAYGGSDRYEIYSVADEINEYIYELLSRPVRASGT